MANPRDVRPTRPGGFDPPEETTVPDAPTAELLASLRDEQDKVTVRRKIVIGPDGTPIVLAIEDDEDGEATARRRITKPHEG